MLACQIKDNKVINTDPPIEYVFHAQWLRSTQSGIQSPRGYAGGPVITTLCVTF